MACATIVWLHAVVQDAQARGMQVGECLALWGSVETPGGLTRQRGSGGWRGPEGSSRRAAGGKYMCATTPSATLHVLAWCRGCSCLGRLYGQASQGGGGC